MKHPKCNNCQTSMIQIYYRKNSKRVSIGYICPFCNGYGIINGPNFDGPIPRNIGPIYIGLNKVRESKGVEN